MPHKQAENDQIYEYWSYICAFLNQKNQVRRHVW